MNPGGLSPAEMLVWVGTVVTAVTVVAGAVGWLIYPRVKGWATDLVSEVTRVGEQLEGDHVDSVGHHAKQAAQAAEELPAIRSELHQLTEWQGGIERRLERTEERLGIVEGGLVALLGPELQRRLFDHLREKD